MKKRINVTARVVAGILAALMILTVCVIATGCAPVDCTSENSTACDVKSKYAMLRLPDDTIIQGYVDRTYTYSSGSIDITIDGVKYRTHWANVAIFEPSN